MDWCGRLLDLVCPRVCYLCRSPLCAGDNRYLCPRCWRRLDLMRGPACLRCAMPLGPGNAMRERCHWCGRLHFAFAQTRAAGVYRGGLRRLLLDFKFRACLQLAEPLAAAIAWQLRRLPLTPAPQLLVPVPLSARRERQRGYNQAALLADALARRLRLPCLDALVKNRDTVPQARLTNRARQRNVQRAFAVAPGCAGKLAGKVVLLVDDVLTTGSTAHACSTLLRREAHARRVSVATVARTVKHC